MASWSTQLRLLREGSRRPICMTAWTLIRRSLRFHARAHLGVVLGAAIGSAALIGALVVGDSVRGSLEQMAMARLGKIELALPSNDRFFRHRLADDLQAILQQPVAPALQVSGMAVSSDGSARANRVQVLGVEDRFWQLANRPPGFTRTQSLQGVVLSRSLAEQLRARPGDEILFRIEKPSSLSREAPIASQQDSSVALRVPVRAVASDEELGRFGLQANQVAPFNAFLPLDLLQQQLAKPGQANLLLVGRTVPRELSALETSNLLSKAAAALRSAWELADSELELRELPATSMLELRSGRVFLERPVVEAIRSVSTSPVPILTYFVNELRVGTRTTPYSMVTAMGAPMVPPEMKDDEVIINSWLADDLQAKPGDELSFDYFVVGTTRRLEEKRGVFRIRSVVLLSGLAADRELMPEFPGVAKAERTQDWDAGFPLQMSKIREKDEQYWKQHRGTPKAFVTLAAGQLMWANRFGALTAMRFPLPATTLEKVRSALKENLDPVAVGLNFEPVRAQALAASAGSQDFGQLFLGFSFFLILAALILMALLFQFGLEQRTAEIGTLLALGFPPQRVRWLLLLEGGALALVGGSLGVIGGIGYARALLYGLTTLWRAAVGTSSLQYHASPWTFAIGLSASVIMAATTIALVLRKQAKRPARELLAEGMASGMNVSGRRGWSLAAAVLPTAGAIALISWALWRGETSAAGAFFGAGFLLLLGGIGFCAALFSWLARATTGDRRFTLTALGVRASARRQNRSLATVALLACGSFLIVAVGANRLEADRGAAARSSGTGGFALFGESTLPVVQDLNSDAGRDFFGLDATAMAGSQVVPLRVREGEEASCLNLNRAQKPRLLGVKPELLSARGAFGFVKLAEGLSPLNPWMRLQRKAGDEVVPAIGDQASIVWAMGKKVGDTMELRDERGRPFKVRLVGGVANSILQGSLVIAEEEFVARFPGESGYRMFLIDTPSNKAATVSTLLTRALQDVGLELTPTTRRLAAFNAVQNTYLNTFQILGGLGLLLGSAGLGVVVLRNVLERRGELALLQAVGFRRRSLRWLVLTEHGALLLLGLAVGLTAALAAILPVWMAPGSQAPSASLGVTLAGVLLSGLLWTWFATWLALRGELLKGLRDE